MVRSIRHLTAHGTILAAILTGSLTIGAALGALSCSPSTSVSASARRASVTGGASRTSTPNGAKGADGFLASNVERADYAGSEACVPCHADISAAWQRSPMHRMTREVPGAEVRAPFDGSALHFKDVAIVLEKRGADRFVRIVPARSTASAKTYRVTRVIGGRTREDFAGVDVSGHGEEVVLPVSFLIGPGTLRYKGYSVMVHERSSVHAGPSWSRTCIFCHNTVPEIDRMLGAVAGTDGRSVPGYQGEQVDRWLPREARTPPRVTDADAFASAANAELARLGGTPEHGDPPAVARHAIDVVRAGFDGSSLVEVGIGCEACHGGAREHTRDPRAHPSFTPVASWLASSAMTGPTSAPPLNAGKPIAATSAPAINRVCARCHQVLFSRYPFTWEGGRRDMMPGGSHINSGEGRDFLLGGCSAAMACTACHDPHGGADDARMRALATPEGNATCTPCHAELADRDRLRAHAHHDPSGAGGSCVACHMPRKNMGLAGDLTRYHRIGSPTDAARVLGDRPLECALCHVDKTVGALADAMEKWWPARYPRQRLEELYGSLDANVMRATLERGKPHEKAVAMASLADARDRSAVPLVARELVGEYPLVREWAKRALVSLRGRCDVDLGADDAAIAKAAVACGASASDVPEPPSRATSRDEDPED
jgi:predicted CXXCH cytochrome family protein